MPGNTFTITVDLKAFFANHKAKVKLFINENIKNVSDLENKITEIFGIRKYHLMCNESLLPSCEDIRVLGSGDTVCALPNGDQEEVKLLNHSYYKEQQLTKIIKEKRKHTIDVVEEFPIVEKKHKKKKREASSPPRDVPEATKNESPKKPEKDFPTIQREKIKTKDRGISWSTNPLTKTTNHVKICKIPVDYSKFTFKSSNSTPDTPKETENFPAFSHVSPVEIQTEYSITKQENPTFATLPLQNNNVEPAPTSTKKETELKNWKHSILEKFTHNLQTEQNIEDTSKNEISSTNRERDEFVNDSSSSTVISKVTKLNPETGRVKKKNQWRQTSGVGYYLKLMDKIGWDSSKPILEESVENEVENSVNGGDSSLDFPTDFVSKRKRKRKHKKRTRPATPIPRILTPLPMKCLEELASNGPGSTPNHIRFGEITDPVSGQGTPIYIEEDGVEECKPEEKIKILQNFSLNQDQPSISIGAIDESGVYEYSETLNSPQPKNVCEVCENERSFM